jgi:hypothetical protein
MTWISEQNWRVCAVCHQVWHEVSGTGVCPTGSVHLPIKGSNYSFIKTAVDAGGTPGWRRCGRCFGLWSLGDASYRCPAGERHVDAGSGGYLVDDVRIRPERLSGRQCLRCGMLVQEQPEGRCYDGSAHRLHGLFVFRSIVGKIRVHAKVIVSPAVTVKTSFKNMRDLFVASAGVEVELVSVEPLPDARASIDVGTEERKCKTPTEQQKELFSNRNGVSAKEIVIYYVRDTYPAMSGCAAHPNGKHGAIVVESASEWTTAHEVGHLLKLGHSLNVEHLMRKGSAPVRNLPPDIDETEAATMRISRLLFPV